VSVSIEAGQMWAYEKRTLNPTSYDFVTSFQDFYRMYLGSIKPCVTLKPLCVCFTKESTVKKKNTVGSIALLYEKKRL